MNWTQQQLGQMPEPDIILHIGAGLCSELPDYQRIQPNQIVLVEPNPETCAELQAQAAGWDNVTVLQAAVTDRTGRATLRLFNFPELDSLHEPVGLYDLLPGLRQVGQAEVATLSASQLIEQLPLEPEGHNWLVLEAPGEELDILTALADCQALERFSRLLVRAGSEAFYKDTHSSSPAVLETLEQLGYTPQARADHADADWPRHHLRLNRMALEYKRLQAEHKADLQATAKALDSLKQVLAESERQHQAELEATRQKQAQAEKDSTQRIQQLESTLAQQKTTSEKLDTKLQEREKEVATLKDKLAEAEQQVSTLPQLQNRLKTQEGENAGLRTQLDNVNKESSESSQQHQARIAELESALADQRGKAERLAGDLQSARDEVGQLKEALAQASQGQNEAQEQAMAQGAELENLTAQLNAANEKAQQHQAQVEKTQADVSLALRLQMLRENDLEELQARYGEVLSIRNEQQELLTQLHQRLSRAAEYLQLRAESEEKNLPDELLEALTGKDEKAG